MRLRYRVSVQMVSGRIYQTPIHTVEGAPDVTDPQQLRAAVERQVTETWVGGSGLFDLGECTEGVQVALATRHIESIQLMWEQTEQPPAAAGGLSVDYADSAE